MALLVRLHCSVRSDIAVERSGSIMQTPFGYHLVICHKLAWKSCNIELVPGSGWPLTH